MPSAADLVIPRFRPILADVFADDGHREFWLDGGRGSTKSSFVGGICIPLLIVSFPFANAVVVRRQGNTLRDSVFEQVLWGIDALGLSAWFKPTVSPMEITYLPTGQKIKFCGMDKPEKVKGLKFKTGYCAVTWWEELDQIAGWSQVRSVRQTLMRGGDRFWQFYTYNPPRSRRSWVNERRLLMLDDPHAVVDDSSYLDVVGTHPEWLGEDFVADAEALRAEDEQAYRHEYLGEPVGMGTEVFDRVEFRTVTDEEIAAFDNPLLGQDFGWYPDPWAFTCSEWRPASRTLIAWHEDGGNKLRPNEQARRINAFCDSMGLGRPYVRSDDADPQAISAQQGEGARARAAGKGRMREASYRWLQSVRWVIDPERCPNLAREVRQMEYATAGDEVLNEIPDGNDHWVDATRYAVMPIVKRGRSAYGTGGARVVA